MTVALLLACAAALALAGFARLRRASQVSPAFVTSAVSIAWWCLAEAMVSLTAAPRVKVWWADAKYLGIVALPGAFLVLALRLAGRDRWVGPRLRLALCIVPVATLALLFTNPRHQLFAAGGRTALGPNWEVVWRPGPVFWIHSAYSYLLISLALAVIARGVFNRWGALSGQMATMLVAAAFPVVASVSHVSHLGGGASGRDPTPFALLVTLALLPVAIGRLRLLELMPADSDAVLSEIPEGLLVLDARDRVVDVNRAAAAMLGRPRSTLVGTTIHSVLPVTPSDLSEAADAGLKLRLRAGEADERHLDLKIAGVRRTGAATTRVVLLRDATARNWAAEALDAARADATARWRASALALEASEARYKALFAVLPHPLFFYDPDSLAIHDLNLAARRNYGCGPDAEPPRSLSELWPAAEVTGLRETLAAASGLPPTVARHRRRDGSVFEVEITIRPVALPDVSGQLLLAVDVTERRRAEREAKRLNEELAAAARLWRGTADALDSALVVVDASERIVRLNRAAADALGLGLQGPLPRSFPEAAQGEPWPTLLEAARVVRRTRAGSSMEAVDPVTHRSWSVLANLAAFQAPERDWVVLVAHETTRLVKLQAALRRQESFALVGSVVAAVAHDVRNPLAILSVSLDALEIDIGDDPRLLEGFEPLRRSIARLTELMQALLAYGNPVAPEWAEVDAVEIVSSVEAFRRPGAATVALAAACTPAPVRGQRSRLLEVFENVIQNAVQHAPAGSQVLVAVERLDDAEGAWVRCRVRDSGPGFGEAELSRVFEPFFSRRRGGTGLGLAIAQRIVEQHGGRIAAANAAEGGAVVTVDLPLVRRP